MAATADMRGYTAGRYGIELDGVMSGFVDEVDGGDATADVVVETRKDGTVRKHIAGVKYEDIVVSCGAGMSNGFFDVVEAMFDGQLTRRNGTIVAYGANYEERSRVDFVNALVTEIGFPALDTGSKNAARMTVKFSPEYTRRKAGDGKSSGAQNKQVQKQWLPSNFRLTIDGLDCTRVNKIDAITVRQKVAENPIGEARDYPETSPRLDFPNLVVTMAETDAQTFFDWHDSFVIKGDSGEDQEKNGTLEYLTPDLKDVLFTLTLSRLGIFRLTRGKDEAASESIRRAKAEMYCEAMTFTYGKAAGGAKSGTAAADDAQPATAGAVVKRDITRTPLSFRAFPTPPVAPVQPVTRALPTLRFRS